MCVWHVWRSETWDAFLAYIVCVCVSARLYHTTLVILSIFYSHLYLCIYLYMCVVLLTHRPIPRIRCRSRFMSRYDRVDSSYARKARLEYKCVKGRRKKIYIYIGRKETTLRWLIHTPTVCDIYTNSCAVEREYTFIYCPLVLLYVNERGTSSINNSMICHDFFLQGII